MIPENKIGNFRIENRDGMTVLLEDDHYWMDDSESEKESHQFAIKVVEKKVLVGGLGLGCILTWFRPEVTEIVVVEKSQDVIDLVWPYIDTSRASIIQMDLKDYLLSPEAREQRFDYIYMDVWPKSRHKSISDWRNRAEMIVAPDRVLCWSEKKL